MKSRVLVTESPLILAPTATCLGCRPLPGCCKPQEEERMLESVGTANGERRYGGGVEGSPISGNSLSFSVG